MSYENTPKGHYAPGSTADGFCHVPQLAVVGTAVQAAWSAMIASSIAVSGANRAYPFPRRAPALREA